MDTIELRYKPLRLDDDEFYEFCRENDQLKIERDSEGTIYIMSNTGGKTGKLNAIIIYWLMHWHVAGNVGHVFDSSTAFRLPNTSVRSPDASWVSNEKWEYLTDAEQTKFPPVCPDFVIELLSTNDDLKTIQNKMQKEWIENGCKLAWLIDPFTQTAFIYRADADVEVLNGFDQSLSGEGVLPGFKFDLSKLKI
ncbi:Endonuclease, Uma2 family (restriction endonuclease fold) [Dyadobacter sp. SG02]|uniref:Uma2 family endonuclease n=1 Tax=Dyadobacter sp. SG02 TaxID=1855291 RepID=UPI0008D19E10|nr:Uma2 family endonuclease [Dyadobacter sp. SG02]SEI88648.1 Endonuclease, Uma2 family (restriction endonuclease fold) [Dyadobacter sp. SG02]